jgi:hypothetical protein
MEGSISTKSGRQECLFVFLCMREQAGTQAHSSRSPRESVSVKPKFEAITEVRAFVL